MQKEAPIINAWLAHYNHKHGTDYQISEFPDETNRNSAEVDAIARDGDHPPLAIEETQLEVFRSQYKLESEYKTVIKQLLDPVIQKTGNDLMFHFPVPEISQLNAKEIKKLISQLSDHINDLNCIKKIENFKFTKGDSEIVIKIHKKKLKKLASIKFLNEANGIDLEKALTHKMNKLISYRKDKYLSVLLISNYDNQNTNQVDLREQYLENWQEFTEHLDIVYLNDETTPAQKHVCLKDHFG